MAAQVSNLKAGIMAAGANFGLQPSVSDSAKAIMMTERGELSELVAIAA